MGKASILIIEDEPSIVDVLVYNLQGEGYDVHTASNGREGLQRCQALLPDLVILDLMLPAIDGLQVCRQLRSDARTQHLLILMLTAKGEETDELVGFHMGADDYVTKPFRIKPLIQRIKALLRRQSSADVESDSLSVAGIAIDRVSHTAHFMEEELSLTPTEFRLLWTLARQPGRTFSRHQLMDYCRGEDANSMERTIDVHVRALRKKLDDDAELIETVRGVGYRFKSDAKSA